MTCIAYRDGILAADSCWECQGQVVSLNRKILKLGNGWLYGAAGDCDDRELLDFFSKHQDHLPSRSCLEEFDADLEAIVVRPHGDVWYINSGKDDRGAFQIKQKFAAIGSGAELARGAMAFGANAEQAIWVACEYDIYCRPPVHVVGFNVEYVKESC